MNWVSIKVTFPAETESLRFRFGLWLDGLLCRVFTWFYEGSKEEVEDGIELAQDGVEMEYLTERQQEISRRLCEWVDVKTETEAAVEAHRRDTENSERRDYE